MDRIAALLGEIACSALLSLFEPQPIRFTPKHETTLPTIALAVRRATGTKLFVLPEPANRNDFLHACAHVTDEEPIEHLIVGYGFKHGSTTKIEAIHHVTGTKGSVALTGAMLDMIERQMGKSHRGEALIFHNHRNLFLNALIDNLPLASSTDRNTAEKLKYDWPQLIRVLFGGGEVKLYLGENHFVKEYGLPPLPRIIALLGQLGLIRPTP